ncbi:MAG TPA: hypothetical protein VHS99_11390 [Chloroflexota bacterium]|jgi:hypothetical protein|nr:hypothetical protein [Chloroflexota bacterium]
MSGGPYAAGTGQHGHDFSRGDRPDRPPVPVFPPRRVTGAPLNTLDAYLAALDASLAGQIDPALEVDGLITPMGSIARASIVEAIGADLEAAVRDLMLAGVPRREAEACAVANLGPAPALGRDLLVARRRQAVEAWQRQRESIWWWTEPLIPVGLAVVAVFTAALAPTIAVIAATVAEPHAGTLAVVLIPLVVGLLIGAAGSLAPGTGNDR